MTESHVPAAQVAQPRGTSQLLRSVRELALSVLVALLVSGVVQLIVNRLPIARPSKIPEVLIMIVGGAGVALIALLLCTRWRPMWSTLGAWIALPGVLSIALSAVLSGSFYFIGGIHADQSFRTAYLTRLTNSPELADFAYANLPPYYPAGWFWIGGRFADLTGLPGWMAYKPYAILTVAVIGVLCMWLWSLVVSKKLALLLASVSTLFGLALGSVGGIVPIGEPYSWLAVITIPPLAVLTWQLLTRMRTPGELKRSYPTAVLIGMVLGLYGSTYTLHFGFAALLLLVLALVAVAVHRRVPGELPMAAFLRRLGTHTLALVLPALAVMALVWTPYVLGTFSGVHGTNTAARFLPGGSTEFPVPFLHFSVGGMLCLLGLGWLVFRTLTPNPYRGLAGGLLITVATAYLWFILSTFALLLDTTLLAFRVEPILLTALFAGGGLAVVDLVTRGMSLLARMDWRRAAHVLAAVLGLFVLVGQVQAFPDSAEGVINKAFADYYPDGHKPDGSSDPADEDYWVPQLDSAIKTLTGRAPTQNIIAGSPPELLFSTEPYYRFQASSPHYANPLGEFDARRGELRRWAKTADAEELVNALESSEYTPPNVFVLHREDGKLRMAVSKDVFPAQPNVQGGTVEFQRSQFTAPQFVTRDVGPYLVAVRTSS